jgi:hypothetical protein
MHELIRPLGIAKTAQSTLVNGLSVAKDRVGISVIINHFVTFHIYFLSSE